MASIQEFIREYVRAVSVGYAVGVKFSKTTLTNSVGTYVVLSTSNSTITYDQVDAGISIATYASTHSAVTETGGFIADLSNATLDKTNHPL